MDLTLFDDIRKDKFRITIGCTNYRYTEKIKDDSRFKPIEEWLYQKYVIEGRGIKSIIKDFNFPVGYSVLRNFIIFLKFKLHSNIESNDFLKKRRSENALKQKDEGIGIFSDKVQYDQKIKNYTQRGIQGYYWNNSKNKYVWLRSSWEFIYAKWLNKNKIEWDVEVKLFKFKKNGVFYKYRPDFFIYKKGKLDSIIEIKGYWKDKVYKTNELELLLIKENISVILITDIKPYTELSLKKERMLWKELRKLK